MPQVSSAAIKQRARALREAAARRRGVWLQSLVGTRQRVLAERGGIGHAECFAPVRLSAGGDVGRILEVEITGFDDDALVGALT